MWGSNLMNKVFNQEVLESCNPLTQKILKFAEENNMVEVINGEFITKHIETTKIIEKEVYVNRKPKRSPISTYLRHEVFKKDKYKCVECGISNQDGVLHIDHIISISQGGSDDLSNLQTLCRGCNLNKGVRSWKGGVIKR